jgi:cell division protein FtsB
LTSAVVGGNCLLADVAGRRARARRGALRVLLALAIATGVAVGAGVLADLDLTRTRRAVELAQSENRALRVRQQILREQVAAFEARLVETVERGFPLAAENPQAN